MTKRMAKVQQRAFAVFMFVPRDDSGLHLNRAFDRMLARIGIACDHFLRVDFQPVKEHRIAQQPVFHHLAIARQKIARRQRGKGINIGQNKAGLMKGADKVLALTRINPGLAANGTVHLCQQGGWQLHKPHAAPQD